MKILITNGRLIDPSQKLDAQKDLVLENGLVKEICEIGSASKQKFDRVIDASNCLVSPGFIDLHTHLREPGFEYKETIHSGTGSAVAGGFTSVCCMANTDPVNDNASVTDYILRKARETGYCRVYPIGAITKGLKGEELAPVAELKKAGCVAISDDGLTVQNAWLMRLALDYAKSFGLPVTTHSIEANLAKNGVMNESFISTKLGLPGSPAAAEDIIVARDIMLAELTGAHLHVGHLSTKGAVYLVEEAKKRGLRVTCEVTPHHFTLSDEAIGDYDTNCKVCPPLRSADDLAAIKAALKRGGVFDAIATDHAPHGIIDKEVEFDKAAWGMVGFETALPLALGLVSEGILSLTAMIALFTSQPAAVFALPGGSLKVGQLADVTVFNQNVDWIVSRETLNSKSKNSPWLGKTLRGKVLYTLVGGELRYEYSKGLIEVTPPSLPLN